MTTNGLKEISDEILDKFIAHKMILNISLDGPARIHDRCRVTSRKEGSHSLVMHNIEKLKNKNYPFAIVAVLDGRIIEEEYSLRELCAYLSNISPIYKIEPVYKIQGSEINVIDDIQEQLLNQERNIIDDIFKGIMDLSAADFVFENNIYRTISNMVRGVSKQYVCSAGSHIAIYPGGNAYSCYNLMQNNFKISTDLRDMNSADLDYVLRQKQELLSITNFPKEYREIKVFGDYCAKENNFSSFAYKYRKNMIDAADRNISKITPGSPQHLALIGYLGCCANGYYTNVPSLI